MCGAEIMALPAGVQRVAHCLLQAGHPHLPQMLDGAARTAQQAAEQLGVAVGQIAKSVVFQHQSSARHVLVLTAGDRRVDTDKVAALIGPIALADAAFVKAHTGFAIGGVSPVAHHHPPMTLLDHSLSRFEVLWTAAGHPHAVFAAHWQQLQALTQAVVADVTQAQPSPPTPCGRP